MGQSCDEIVNGKSDLGIEVSNRANFLAPCSVLYTSFVVCCEICLAAESEGRHLAYVRISFNVALFVEIPNKIRL